MPAIALLLAACKPVDVTWPDGEASAASGPETIALADAHNYAYTVDNGAPPVTTAEGVDLRFDWSGLEDDLGCGSLDPAADIGTLTLLAVAALDPEATLDAMLDDGLTQADVGGQGSIPTAGATSARWSDLEMRGLGEDRAADYVDGGATWLVAVGDSASGRPRAFRFLDPDPLSSNTEVSIADACLMLDYAVELEALTRPAAGAAGPWTVDWSGITTGGRGQAVDLATVDGLSLLHYAHLDVADLEDPLLPLDGRADATRAWDVSGRTSLDLETPPTAGDPLGALDPEGTWLLALTCSACFDPAPVFLTVLDVGD